WLPSPGPSVTSTTVARASLPSSFSAMSCSDSVVTLALPCLSGSARVIPPIPRAAPTTIPMSSRTMEASCSMRNHALIALALYASREAPTACRGGLRLRESVLGQAERDCEDPHGGQGPGYLSERAAPAEHPRERISLRSHVDVLARVVLAVLLRLVLQ